LTFLSGNPAADIYAPQGAQFRFFLVIEPSSP